MYEVKEKKNIIKCVTIGNDLLNGKIVLMGETFWKKMERSNRVGGRDYNFLVWKVFFFVNIFSRRKT